MNNTIFHVCQKNTKHFIENNPDKLIVLIIPFSDPIAEDPIIQTQCTESLKDGFNIKDLFKTLQTLKHHSTLIIKTYANVVYSYGKDYFMNECEKANISGLIIPDLPFEEKEEFDDYCNNHRVSLIPIVSTTSLTRISKILPSPSDYVYLSYRSQDHLENTIQEIIKYTNAYIIKS